MKPFLVVKAFSSRSHHYTKRATNDDFSLHRLHHHDLPHDQRPILAVMRMRAATGASAGAAVEMRFRWITMVATRSNKARHSLPPPPPLPPVPPTTTPPPLEALPLRLMLSSPGIYHSRRMQLLRECRACGGRGHHRHHHHLWRVLPPTTPPTSAPTASAEIATTTINPADIAIAAVSTQSKDSWGSGTVTAGGSRGGVTGGGGGRREGAAGGARGRREA